MNLHALLLSAPFTIPLLGVVVTYFFSAHRIVKPLFLLLHLAASFALLATVLTSGTIAASAGEWMAPYGIVLIADPFAALMLAVSSLVFFCCLIGKDSHKTALSMVLFFLQAGVSLSFVSGDFFNLFVAFELMLISSYVVMVLSGRRERLGNAYAYISMNVIASMLYLVAVAIFYGYTGSLNFAALAQQLQDTSSTLILIPLFVITIVLIIKIGVFPFYFWLPDSYPLLSSHLAGLFGGILSKVGVYVLYRLFLTVFTFAHPWIDGLLLTLACLTMLLGVIGAVSKNTIKGILSYHILSQVGYMIFALMLSTTMAVTAGIIFIIHNIVVKSSLFLIGGIAESKCRSDNIKAMGRLWDFSPGLGVLFLLQGFSLAGLPPLSGFLGKYLIFFEGMSLEAYLSVSAALVTSFLTLFSMMKIWNNAFIGDAVTPTEEVPLSAYFSPIVLTAVALCIGIFAEQTFKVSNLAAEMLINNEGYITSSLESGRKGANL